MATTIQVSAKLQQQLNKMKMSERETYEDIIWDLLEDRMELSEQTKRNIEQSRNATWRLRAYGTKTTKLQLDINGLLEDLKFVPDTAKTFEEAMREVAEFIGFKAQRPENDFGKGPDVLWAVGGLRYFVIECKNGAVSQTVNKSDCNQLTGSIMWFRDRYDHSCSSEPILVHPSYLRTSWNTYGRNASDDC